MKVKKQGGRISIVQEEETICTLALKDVERIVVLSDTQISTQVLYALLEQGSSVIYLHKNGDFVGTLAPNKSRPVRLMEQVHLYDDEERKIAFVREILHEKITGQRNLLSRYGYRNKKKMLFAYANKIKSLENSLDSKNTLAELRGVEGITARLYFNCFPELLDDSEFKWQGRKKRPAPDPINAMLSFGYTLLSQEVTIAIRAFGLEAGLGFLHEPDTYRDSLVYDFMEQYRSEVIDQFVLRCANWNVFSLSDFETTNKGCRFKEAARNKWIQLYEDMMERKIDKYKSSQRERIKTAVSNFAYMLDRRYKVKDADTEEQEGNEGDYLL